jgi:2-octaprenyl-6-methoxyphenol hydroxylase
MNDSTDKQYDIVIAGGGMIGASLALALSPLGLRIAVVEAVARGEAQQPSFDDRSTALSRSTQRMFEAMGLWDDVISAATPIRRIHVSDRGRFGFSHIDAAEQGVEALGYVVINRVLGEVLQSALANTRSSVVSCW